MKRTLSCALALLTLLPALLTPARANSAPTHWEGSPGSEVLAVEADCPIAVLHEDLSFQVAESDDYSLNARVKAVYQMENPTAEDRKVQMAFSLEESVWDFDPGGVSITAGGETLPFQLVWDGVSPDYRPRSFDPDQTGTLYTFHLSSAPEGSENTLTLPAPQGNLWVDCDGIHSYSGEEDGSLTLGSRQEATVWVYALNGVLDYTVSGGYTVDTEEVPFSAYFRSYLEEQYGDRCAGYLDSLAACKYRQLEEQWASSPVALMEWLENLDYSDVPLQFLYTANFPAGETVEVAVSYNTRSDGAREGTADWQHTFTYLLSPARHWASFGTLDVTVDAGESGYPYVIASSLPLEAQPDGSYSAHAEGLPEEDLSFTLYSAPQLSLSDRVTSTLGITTYTLALWRLLAIPAGLVLVLLLGILLWRRNRKKGH